ncbi:MAG: hypothetical protein ACLFVO_06875 [Chloroflexaceae bacterium]
MQSEYTEQDTERNRQVERSSAGQQTQRLSPMPQDDTLTPAHPQGRNNLAALALIGLGVLLLLGRFAPLHLEFEGGIVLLTIASCFLFFAFWKRIFGLVIPGCILAGLSIGVTFADVTEGVSVLWGLALGFLAILFVGRAMFNLRSHWPIYPAVPLFAVGVIVAVANLPAFFASGLVWLPVLLIGLGIYLGWGRRTA